MAVCCVSAIVLRLIYITNLLQVRPIKEYEYCFRIAEEGGHQQYKDAIFPDVDDKRDAGQAGMPVEGFMQQYLDSLISLMTSVHAANLQSCCEKKLESEKGLLCSMWEHIIDKYQATAKAVYEETKHSEEYQGLRELLVGYNLHIKHSPRSIQSLNSYRSTQNCAKEQNPSFDYMLQLTKLDV